MRRLLMAGAMMIGAFVALETRAEAQRYRPPTASPYYRPAPPWNHGGGYGGKGYHGGGYGGGYYGGSQYVGRGGYVTNRPGDGLPPVYNRPGDGLPPLPAQRLPNGQYIVNRPGDGLAPFVVGRPRY